MNFSNFYLLTKPMWSDKLDLQSSLKCILEFDDANLRRAVWWTKKHPSIYFAQLKILLHLYSVFLFYQCEHTCWMMIWHKTEPHSQNYSHFFCKIYYRFWHHSLFNKRFKFQLIFILNPQPIAFVDLKKSIDLVW